MALSNWHTKDEKSIYPLQVTNAIKNGELHHYSATISKTGVMKIYLDGNLIGQHKKGKPIANVARSSNYLGRSNWCAYDPDLKGFLGDVKIYNRDLSEAEIKALYNLQ